jgi:Membrane domain of glycerophosphoryl diester phosphodiesterase
MNPTEGVLSEAWTMYKAHWQHLLSIALAVYVAVALISLVLHALLDRWAAGLLTAVVSLLATFWLQGALVKAIDDIRDGRADLSFGETFAVVRPMLPAIIVGGVLAGIGVVLGLILLIVPGLYLLTRWILIIPVIVLEGRRAGESFGRSWELVKGFGWNVFGVIVLTILILIGFRIALDILLFPLSNAFQSLLTELIAGTLATPFAALAWTLLYFRLREAKEPAAAPAPAPAV